MIIGTFNGLTIVSFPASPSFTDIRLDFHDAVGVATSPFSLQSQIQQWPGADLITGEVSLPPMTKQQVGIWNAFLAECAGQGNAFQLGDPSICVQGNPGSSAPIVGTANVAATKSLNTTGWAPNRFNLLKAGDWFQIGYRLHLAMEPVNSDVSGDATIAIWPSLREVPAVGETVVVNKPKGLFRLASNQRGYSSSVKQLFGIEFKITEAR